MERCLASSLPCRRAALVAFWLGVALAPARCGVVPRRSKAAGAKKAVDGVIDQYASLITSAPRAQRPGLGCTLTGCMLAAIALGSHRQRQAFTGSALMLFGMQAHHAVQCLCTCGGPAAHPAGRPP